jgi:N-acetylated-alpha-linked acidic dipeptidase
MTRDPMLRVRAILVLALLLTPAARGSAGEAAGDRPADPPGGPPSGPEARALVGFAPGPATDARRQWERTLLAVPQPDSARRHLAFLTEEPHVAGTPADYATAVYVRDRLRSYGLDAQIVEYSVLLNYPKHVSLALVEPEAETLSLREAPLEGDKDSADSSFFDGFHGYSADGKVTAQVVYANYGRPEDFDALDKLGISVQGRIALVRYGQNFRGLKVRAAQERGAVGVIIYSDPADDGYAKGDTYPRGPWRNPTAIQRGSVQFLSNAPGDPTTPGWPSVKGAKRIPRSQMTNLPRIPSLPLAYAEAQKILSRLDGPNVPEGFQGALPFAYHTGPGRAKVHMEVVNDYAIRPIWDVIATLPGSEQPDRWVVCGNHRDAWVYGASDPNSGTAALLETARALAKAYAGGPRPRRSIVLCSWDGEEYGLLGSTEWGEQGERTLPGKVVAYLNLDSAVRGRNLSASGVPSLRDLVVQVARDVPDPVTGSPLLESWQRDARKAGLEKWRQEERLRKARSQPSRPLEVELGPLGSGSDFTVFLDHLGIPAMDFRFSGPDGIYHSAYDDLAWMDRFGDRLYLYHAVAARTWAVMASRLADAPVLPLRYSRYGRTLDDALEELSRRVEEANEDLPPANRLSFDGSRARSLASRIRIAGQKLETDADTALSEGRAEVNGRTLAAWNDELLAVERDLLSADGVAGRPWFRHLVYAPGKDAGYEAVLLPEPAQAVRDRSQPDLDAGMRRLEAALERAAGRLEAMASGR